MTRTLADLLTYTSMFSVLLPLLIGSLRLKYLNPIQSLIGLLVMLTLVGEVSVFSAAYFLENNLPVVHFFTVTQFVLIVLILEKGLLPLFSKPFFRSIILAFILFALVDAFYLNGLYHFNSYSRPLASFLLLFFSLSFFYKTLKELKIKTLEREPLLWISVGVLLYFSGNLFIFISTNYFQFSNPALLTLWGIHALFNIVLNIAYSIALWVNPVK